MRMYYINNGTYNSFIEELMGLKSNRIPKILFEVVYTFFTSVPYYISINI